MHVEHCELWPMTRLRYELQHVHVTCYLFTCYCYCVILQWFLYVASTEVCLQPSTRQMEGAGSPLKTDPSTREGPASSTSRAPLRSPAVITIMISGIYLSELEMVLLNLCSTYYCKLAPIGNGCTDLVSYSVDRYLYQLWLIFCTQEGLCIQIALPNTIENDAYPTMKQRVACTGSGERERKKRERNFTTTRSCLPGNSVNSVNVCCIWLSRSLQITNRLSCL